MQSVMHIIASCIKCNTELTITCDGEDEEEALARAVELIETGLDCV
jgi:phosphocarrier protein